MWATIARILLSLSDTDLLLDKWTESFLFRPKTTTSSPSSPLSVDSKVDENGSCLWTIEERKEEKEEPNEESSQNQLAILRISPLADLSQSLPAPTQHAKLHIFEPRYKLMAKEAIEKKKAFGIAPTASSVGTTVHVSKFHLQNNGDLYLDVIAKDRFEIISSRTRPGSFLLEEAEVKYMLFFFYLFSFFSLLFLFAR
jgi:hypothetical protein